MNHKSKYLPHNLLKHLFIWRRLKGGQKTLFWVGVVALLLVLIPIVIETLSESQKADAAWYNTSYLYRQPITLTISSTSTAYKNVDTLVTVDTSTLISASKLQSGCQDLRFTDANGNALHYYIDSGCDTSSTKIWVRVASVPTNTTTYALYMYYGNNSAAAGSDPSLFTLYKGLVGYWPMNESSWNNNCSTGTVMDTSVNSDNGNSCPSSTGSTTPVSGKFGNAGSFSGSQLVELPSISNIRSVSMWAYINSGQEDNWHYLLDARTGLTSGYFSSFGIGSNWTGGQMYINGVSKSVTWANIPKDQWVHIYLVSNTAFTDDVYLMGRYGASEELQGKLDDVRFYNRILSQSEINKLYSNPGTIASVPSTISKPAISFGDEAQAPGPVANWNFDEGYGTTTHDSTSNKSDGTLSGTTKPVWQTKEQCISGKCLSFDGSTSYVQVADPANGSLDFGTNDFTVNLWEYRTTSGTNVLIGKRTYPSAGWTIYFNNSSLVVQLDDSSAHSYTVGTLADTNTWHQISIVVKRSTNQLLYYLDGQLQSTTSISAITGSLSTSTWLGIGRDSSDGGHIFDGRIDGVQIYPYARSAAQIKSNYSSTLAGGGSAVLGAAANTNLTNGLVGYWKMDEDSWDGTSGEVIDSSGTGNNGTAAGDATTAAGKFGNGGSFDGTGDEVDISDSSSLDLGTGSVSISAWVNVPEDWTGTAYRSLFLKASTVAWSSTSTNGYGLLIGNNGELNLPLPGVDPATTGSGASVTVPANTWTHVTGIYDAEKHEVLFYINGVSAGVDTNINPTSLTNAIDPIIANGVSRILTGSLDEVRIYNRALSASEVQQLYNYAPGPIGYWNFDGNTSDLSGNGNNGTWSGTGTHYVAGKYGKAANFNGSNDQLLVAHSSTFSDLKNGTFEVWVKPTYVSPGSGIRSNIINKNAGGSNNGDVQCGIIQTYAYRCVFEDGTNSVQYDSTKPLTRNQWNYVSVTWSNDGSNITFTTFINGVKDSSTTGTSTTLPFSSNVSLAIAGTNYSGQVDDVKFYNYARTPAQITEDMNGGHPLGGSPVGSQVGYWKFDEGSGTTAHNSGNQGSTLDGTLSGTTKPTWTNAGKFGKALSFDGSSSYIALGNVSALKTDIKTISFWAKPDTAFSSYTGVISAGGSANYYAGFHSNGRMILSYSDSTCSQVAVYSNNNVTTTNEWHQYTYVMDVSGSNVTISFYKDGQFLSNATHTTGVCSTYGSNFILGAFNTSGSGFYSGLLDDVKFYNSALTEQEIQIDYNHNSAISMGSLGTDASGNPSNSTDRMYCPPGDTTASCGPVGEWDFEEGNGSTVNDTSGNNNSGTWNGTGSTHWVQGKIGKAGNFNGSDNYIEMGDPANGSLDFGTGAMSVSVWVKYTSSANNLFILDKKGGGSNNAGYNLVATAGKIIFKIANGSSQTSIAEADTSNDGKWHHIVGVLERGTGTGGADVFNLYKDGILNKTVTISLANSGWNISGTDNFEVGDLDNHTGFWPGQIDQLQVYNYALSPAQVAWNYNRGAPIASYNFDECQGTTLHDSSNNHLDATITVGASGTQTSAGTCTDGLSTSAWNNGATGKYNSSLSFDGTDDYASLSDNDILDIGTGSMTWSMWFKDNQTARSILYRKSDGSGANGALIDIGSSAVGQIRCFIGYPTSVIVTSTKRIYNDNSWHHLTCALDRPNNKLNLYVDGILDNSVDASSLGTSNLNATAIMQIGQGSGSFIKGQIDDVQIFNYPLTPQQVKQVYNQGSAIRFGPNTGTP